MNLVGDVNAVLPAIGGQRLFLSGGAEAFALLGAGDAPIKLAINH
jgi:hypothetical protein